MAIFRVFGAGEWGLAVANDLSLGNNLVEVYIRDNNKLTAYKNDGFHKGLGLAFNLSLIHI